MFFAGTNEAVPHFNPDRGRERLSSKYLLNNLEWCIRTVVNYTRDSGV
jgi:hypothetical protein